jgi:hypothetical protein
VEKKRKGKKISNLLMLILGIKKHMKETHPDLQLEIKVGKTSDHIREYPEK